MARRTGLPAQMVRYSPSRWLAWASGASRNVSELREPGVGRRSQQYGYDVVSLMPTNLYGPADNFDLQTAHVLPALIRKIHEARVVNPRVVRLWGTGRPRREFLHVDDAADAVVYCLEHVTEASHLNVGCGEDISIAGLVASIVGWSWEVQVPIRVARWNAP